MSFKFLLFLLTIVRCLAATLLVIFNYTPSKEIVLEVFDESLQEFYKKYVYNNYYLNTIGLNEFSKIDEAISLSIII